MPTTNKRVYITIPASVEEDLKNYMARYGIRTYATACTQLITRALENERKAQETMDMLKQFTPEQLEAFSAIGLQALQTGILSRDNRK